MKLDHLLRILVAVVYFAAIMNSLPDVVNLLGGRNGDPATLSGWVRLILLTGSVLLSLIGLSVILPGQWVEAFRKACSKAKL